MTITSSLFEAFLKCPTKCWLRARNEPPGGNVYAEWVKGQNESYRVAETNRLVSAIPPLDCAVSPPADSLKSAKWRLASEVVLRATAAAYGSRSNEVACSPPGPYGSDANGTFGGLAAGSPAPGVTSASPDSAPDTSPAQPDVAARPTASPPACLLETCLHLVERVPAEGRGKPAQFIPIRCISFNKLTKEHKLLLAYDALVFGQVLGRDIAIGKLIHGDEPAALKEKTSAMAGEVRKHLEKIAVLLSCSAPPDLVLSRRCAECEFEARCRKIAIEKDDLSLLGGMSSKERQKLRSKGIFTVAQLSYTFRPRRRPKRLRDEREKYHHALKALAIREKKIHIVGSPEFKIEGTPVYLDVEGLPDRDFYYLIGLRIGSGDSAVQHSLWADAVADEGKIWQEFLSILETVEKPVLIHYGSYETTFLKRMTSRHGGPSQMATSSNVLDAAVNLLEVIYGQVYFPTYSNTLKEVGGFLCGAGGLPAASGLSAITWRVQWESLSQTEAKQAVLDYNRRDCTLLVHVAKNLQELVSRRDPLCAPAAETAEVVYAEELLRERQRWEVYANPQYALDDFRHLVKLAYWDYQRERVFIRANNTGRGKRACCLRRSKRHRINATVSIELQRCPHCTGMYITPERAMEQRLLDLKFSGGGVKRWVTKLVRWRYSCLYCQRTFAAERTVAHSRHYGHGLLCWCVYLSTFCGLNMNRTCRVMSEVFDIDLPAAKIGHYKEDLAVKYTPLAQEILERLKGGPVLHVDETFVNMRGQTAYVWVFTSLDMVYYLYRPSREAGFLDDLLAGFKGILVSDFFSGYDGLNCPQQKCLVHLIRDINEDLLRNPSDQELKLLAHDFGTLLRSITSTVDQHGLKRRYLQKHKGTVQEFLKKVASGAFASEAVNSYKKRFEKSGDKMFTFLDHDGVPWNNNNAEHAIKLFAKYRARTGARFTEETLKQYLIIATVFETCEFNDVNVLKFLLSQETTLDGCLSMAGSKPRLRRRWHKEWGTER